MTGMTWSGFRPSDDCCEFGYLIPSNMMAVTALRYGEEICRECYQDLELAGRCQALAEEILDGRIGDGDTVFVTCGEDKLLFRRKETCQS